MGLNHPILFFDGDCGFCNKSVQFVLRHEKSNEIVFASLQSDFSSSFFKKYNFPKPDLSTFYYFDGEKIYEKSTAALKTIAKLKWYCKPLLIGWIFPKLIRDFWYNLVAKRRNKLSKEFCLIPNKEQINRIHLI